MVEEIIYSMEAPYREKLQVRGYHFGKKEEKTACILGPIRGNEIQQLYICSQLVHALRELEHNGCINNNKGIMVIPCVNYYGMNIGKRFWPVDNTDINRKFPGMDYGDTTERIAAGVLSAIRDYLYDRRICAACQNDGNRISECITCQSVRYALCCSQKAEADRYKDFKL